MRQTGLVRAFAGARKRRDSTDRLLELDAKRRQKELRHNLKGMPNSRLVDIDATLLRKSKMVHRHERPSVIEVDS